MKQQSNAEGIDVELDYVKCRKRVYRDEFDKSICIRKKRIQNDNRFSLGNGRYAVDDQDDESLSENWNEKNLTLKTDTRECSVIPNVYDERNGTKIMSPITTTAYNSNDSLSSRDYYYSNDKPKSSMQLKKPRPDDGKYDFNEFVGGDNGHQMDKLSLQINKSEYENNSEYRCAQSFSQNSAFHPPSLYEAKKSNSFGSMPHSAYHHPDSSGYSTYSSLDRNVSANSSPERDPPPFGKTLSKDDDMNATADYKEYTTLQPAGVGSKAASVIQDVAREGGAVSVVVMNSMSNASVQNTITTVASTDRTTFLERPIAAFSPASSNKGKIHKLENKCLLHV